MKIQALNKSGNIIVDFVSKETRNIASNKAICYCYAQCVSVFAVYVDGVLDCFSETADKLAFPKTL